MGTRNIWLYLYDIRPREIKEQYIKQRVFASTVSVETEIEAQAEDQLRPSLPDELFLEDLYSFRRQEPLALPPQNYELPIAPQPPSQEIPRSTLVSAVAKDEAQAPILEPLDRNLISKEFGQFMQDSPSSLAESSDWTLRKSLVYFVIAALAISMFFPSIGFVAGLFLK